MSSGNPYFIEWKHITYFTYHLDVFEDIPNVSIRSFRRINEYAFNITIVIRIPTDSVIKNDGFGEGFEQIIEKIYCDYVKSDRFKREEYKTVNQMVHDFLIKYPNLA